MSDKWIYREIHPYLHQANRNAGWNFEWDWSEACQFTEYKKGQFYDWHCDSYEEPYDHPDNKNTHGKLRKLSMTVSLTDPKEYEGGDLEFDFRNTDEGSQPRICEEIRKKGIQLSKELHPDQLRAQGVPQELIIKSEDRLSEINQAYDKIKSLRKIN